MSKLLSAKEVGELLGIKTRSVYQKVFRNEIPYVKPGNGRILRFDQQEIENYINVGRKAALGGQS